MGNTKNRRRTGLKRRTTLQTNQLLEAQISSVSFRKSRAHVSQLPHTVYKTNQSISSAATKSLLVRRTSSRKNLRAGYLQAQEDLKRSNDHISGLESELDATRLELRATQIQLQAAHELLQVRDTEVRDFARLFRNKCRALQRQKKTSIFRQQAADEAAQARTEELRQLHVALAVSNQDYNRLAQTSVRVIGGLQEQAEVSHRKIGQLNIALRDKKRKISSLDAKLRFSIRNRAKAITRAEEQAKKQSRKWVLMENGIYTPSARRLSRALVKAGCSRGSVGPIMQEIAVATNKEIPRDMTRRTVGRTIIEAGMASLIQLGHELSNVKYFTCSSDATSNRTINYNSTHITLSAPNYRNPAAAPTPKTRFLGISTTVNHTSETQVASLKDRITNLAEVFNRSPLAEREQLTFTTDDFATKLRGWMGDHAKDVKKCYRLLGIWKSTVIRKQLGYEHILELEVDELEKILDPVEGEMFAAAGGREAWLILPEEDRKQRRTIMMDSVAYNIGAEIFLTLSKDEQDELDVMFCGGCTMHKDLNAVKGGCAWMARCWKLHRLPEPVTLANKDNDAVLRLSETANESSEAVNRALQVSGRGGAKLTSIAGALFNHKDDKKGHQDSQLYMQELECGFRPPKFPDTSNTRYQSHCNAARELIVNTEYYDNYVSQIVRFGKEKPGLNHLEENFLKGLRDSPTIHELATMALYGQLITHPYMRVVRGPGTENVNLLTLGPFHDNLKAHLRKLLSNSMLAFSSDAAYETSTLDGKPYENPELVYKVISMVAAGKLPHLKICLDAFLGGALETWERFTEEFHMGGLIANATPEQLNEVFIPATNDANEGALGSVVRKASRENPNVTMGHASQLAEFFRNDTQSHMDRFYSGDDHRNLMQEARRYDASGVEKAQRLEHAKVHTAKAKDAEEKRKVLDGRKAAIKVRLASTDVVMSRTGLEELGLPALKDQVDLHREAGDDIMPPKSHLKNKAMFLSALYAALTRLEDGLTMEEEGMEGILAEDGVGQDDGEVEKEV